MLQLLETPIIMKGNNLPKVLVLGSDGMIGSEIYKSLLKSDFDVFGSTRRKSTGPLIFIDVKDLDFEQDFDFLAPDHI